MHKFLLTMVFSFFISMNAFAVSGYSLKIESDSNPCLEEPRYCIAKAPLSMRELWQDAPTLFSNRKYVKPHDNRLLSKWYQLQKLWSKNKNESGHFERKESIVITSDDNNIDEMKKCRKDLQHLCEEHLSSLENKYKIEKNTLTMKDAFQPTHTLRLLHYLPNATATAHCDTSIMTCLYYREQGLQLKIDGKWIEAPTLKQDEMLVTYGVPGEILSNGAIKAVRHRVKCDERYVVAYFHNTPKDYVLASENYQQTTMTHLYQEAQLWYADVNARIVRHLCKSTKLSPHHVILGWIAQKWTTINEDPISKKIN